MKKTHVLLYNHGEWDYFCSEKIIACDDKKHLNHIAKELNHIQSKYNGATWDANNPHDDYDDYGNFIEPDDSDETFQKQQKREQKLKKKFATKFNKAIGRRGVFSYTDVEFNGVFVVISLPVITTCN